MADDTTRDALVAEVVSELTTLITWLVQEPGLDLATAEQETQARLRAVGARLLEAGLAMRGSGKVAGRLTCPCGATAACEGYRPKGVQTLVGWITLRRAYYRCPVCGRPQVPLDQALGLGRASHSPGVRRLATRLGALLPYAQATATLREVAGLALSASTLRGLTSATGATREGELTTQTTFAWQHGLPPIPGPAPERLYIAMDGVRILTTDGEGKEAKVGVVRPEQRTALGWQAAPASYTASFAEAAVFGPRLALEAYRRGAEGAGELIVLGDGAAWIWALAEEHFPDATQIVDWYHASERIWALGRVLYGEGPGAATSWVTAQLDQLGTGQVLSLVAAWTALELSGVAAEVRAEQVTYFTNQASRMAYDRYRARGLDVGSGMVESACKYVIGAREKGPGMRWSVAGAQAVANLRVLLCNDQWDAYWQEAA